MTRHFGIPRPTRAETAARITTAAWWPGDPPGRLWRPKEMLADMDEPREPRWQAYLCIAGLGVAMWGVIGLCVTVVVGLLVAVL